MVFIDNKYTKLYYNIISTARSSDISHLVYTETHHILPKCLTGTDSAENLVKLTARQHFVCHWLLTKMVNGENKNKMIFALNKMLSSSKNQHRYKITGRKYELLKIQFNKANLFNDPNWQLEQRKRNHIGKKRSEETKQKLKDAWAKSREHRTGINHPNYGKTASASTKQKQSLAMTGKLVGEKNPMYGKSHSDEVKKILSENLRNNPIPKTYLECKFCLRIVDAGNYKRWHGNKCKLNNK